MRAKYVFVLMLVLFSCLDSVAQDAWKGVLSKAMDVYSKREQYFINSHAELRATVDTAGLIEENDMLSWKVGNHVGMSMPFGYKIQEDSMELLVDTMQRYMVLRRVPEKKQVTTGPSLIGSIDSLAKFVTKGEVKTLEGERKLVSLTFLEPYPLTRMELVVDDKLSRFEQVVSYYREIMNFSATPLDPPRYMIPKMTLTHTEPSDISKRPRIGNYVRLKEGTWETVEPFKTYQLARY